MGKATFVRYVAVLPVRYVVVALPCAGGVLFLLGSFCFWPGSGEAATTVGAACFVLPGRLALLLGRTLVTCVRDRV